MGGCISLKSDFKTVLEKIQFFFIISKLFDNNKPVDWDFIPSRVILKTLKIVFAAFAPGARHKRKCEGFCVCVVRHVMSLNSVQSFVIENCNGPTIENGLNHVCIHPLSRTFTFKHA